jgi:hypothetical protein
VVAAPQVRVVLGCQREGQGRPARYRRRGGGWWCGEDTAGAMGRARGDRVPKKEEARAARSQRRGHRS